VTIWWIIGSALVICCLPFLPLLLDRIEKRSGNRE
jgi:hypothetical protein